MFIILYLIERITQRLGIAESSSLSFPLFYAHNYRVSGSYPHKGLTKTGIHKMSDTHKTGNVGGDSRKSLVWKQ